QSQTNYNNQQNDNTERQRIQSVPKKQPTRLQQSTGERKYQMNNSAPKNNTRNVVNMNNQDQKNYGFTQERSKICLFKQCVFSNISDNVDEINKHIHNISN